MVTAISVTALYNNTKAILKMSGNENYRMEASLLIEKVTGFKKHELAILGYKIASQEQIEQISKLIERRKSGEPLQYIVGEWEFYGLNFKVGKGVLIPRQDTETLIDVVIEELKSSENPCIVDLCSGSGCIAVTLDKNLKDSQIFAVELSDEAIPFLNENIAYNNSDVKVVAGDVLDENILCSFPQFDCIVSNPPYLTENDMVVLQKEVRFEPEMALKGGNDGLYFYREIIRLWSKKLKQNGLIAFEIGINQEDDVKNILKENGYKDISFKKDLCGIIRVVYGRKI